MKSAKTTLYRDKENAKLFGVCAGIADYAGVNSFWIRLGALFAIPFTGGWIVPIYLLAGFLLNKKPPHLYRDQAEQKYWQGVRQNPKRTTKEIRAEFRDIDRRLADVEHFYVSSNPRLSNEIEKLR